MSPRSAVTSKRADEDLCRWAGSDRSRVIPGRHTSECADPEACEGCAPCPRPHCRRCGKEHALGTCPACVDEIRSDLTELVGLYEHDLRAQEVADSVDADPAESEALALRGPVAHQEAWYYLNAAGRVIDDQDPRNPLWVLGTWELVVREWRSEEPADSKPVTVRGAFDYLDGHLEQLGHAADVPLEQLASEVRDCIQHVRAVIGDRQEIRKQCPKCGHQTLVRRWETLAGGYKSGNERRQYRDRWRCTRRDCKAEWSDNDYRSKVEATYLNVADKLTLRDMEDRTGIPGGTLRRWASLRRIQRPGQPVEVLPPVLTAVGRSPDGRKLYKVSDVQDLRHGVCDLTSRRSA